MILATSNEPEEIRAKSRVPVL